MVSRKKIGISMNRDCDLSLADIVSIIGPYGIPYAFIIPTETGLKKSIMDATEQVRTLLKEEGIHDYSAQKQGPENKVLIKGFFVSSDKLISTNISLYRPITKNGDPRIWFSGCPYYASPLNVLIIFVYDKKLYLFNLSNEKVRTSILSGGFAHQVLLRIKDSYSSAKEELLSRLREISEKGWIPATGKGDFSVGDTLEHLLGISRNSSKLPDYKGIELKASRLSVNGKKRTNRNTLFSLVPDDGMNYRQIIENFGRNCFSDSGQPIISLYDTIKAGHIESFGLTLIQNEKLERIELAHVKDSIFNYVASWSYSSLRKAASIKHHETFFVKADSKIIDGIEFFHYRSVVHTSKPNVIQIPDLIASGIISVDLAGHIVVASNFCRNHGMLWKINPSNLHLFANREEIITLC